MRGFLKSTIGFVPQDLTEWVAAKVLRLFEWSVGLTVIITIVLAIIDSIAMWNHVIQPSERLVTEKVLMTLIGASVVQVGAASAAIVYALFKKPPPTES